MMTVDEFQKTDIDDYIELRARLDQETIYLLKGTNDSFARRLQMAILLKEYDKLDHITLLLAKEGQAMTGFVAIDRGQFKRNRLTANVNIGVLKSYWRQGIGSKLLEKGIAMARQKKIHRLQLALLADNKPALEFFKKFGFEQEGVRRESVFLDDMYIDENYLALII